MEEIKKKSTFNIMYGTSLFIVLGFALSAIDFNYLITLIRNIDALCSEIVRIDQQLEEVSSVFSTHVSEAFVISASGQIGDLIVNFRKLGVFNTTNRDYLNNF